MVKNYILWLVFVALITVTSASVCLASQNSEKPQKEKSVYCPQSEVDNNKEGTEINKNKPVAKESEDEDVHETPPSILNSNFIFYIIYKFKFVDYKSNQNKYENEDKAGIPLLSYARNIYRAINSLIENKF